jgi:hypothetical protein
MDKSRIGLFTSSKIFKLMTVAKDKKSFGAPALSYIESKRREKRLKASIDLETTARPLSWGKAMEGYLQDTHLGIEYELLSSETDVHESGMFAGTKDFIKGDTVGDIKCPMTRDSLCDLVAIIENGTTEGFKIRNPEYYYQIVSNSILTNKEYGELIVFMPYASEIPAIIEYIELIDDFQLQRDIQWVAHEALERIPHLPDNSGYKNINKFRFEIPKNDKEELLSKIKKAHKLLTSAVPAKDALGNGLEAGQTAEV